MDIDTIVLVKEIGFDVADGAEPTLAQTQEILARAGQAIVMDGFERRSRRGAMTGEWLIYYVHEGRNCYLDLAQHAEQENEEALYHRLRAKTAGEFPFAFG